MSRSGAISYRVKVRLRGDAPRTRTFRRKSDAEAWAKAAETDLSRGLYVPTTSDRRRTVAELIDRTIADHLPNKTLAMAKRYSHQSSEFTRSVFEKLSGRIDKEPTGKGSGK